MTHFTVLVIGEDIDEILAPYSENLEVEPYTETDSAGEERATTYNPLSKWDWYEIGGRWSGVFPLLPGKTGTLGKPGVFDNKPEEGRVDQCKFGDVDWDLKNKEAGEHAGKEWDMLFEPYDPKKCMWKPEYVEKQREVHLKVYGTREEYVKRRGIWMPYAVVSEKGWFAPGEMGWWGMSSDETEDRDAFVDTFKDIMSGCSDDTLITCVDCHI